MGERAKREGQAGAADAAAVEVGNGAGKESLLSQGLHAIESMLGGSPKPVATTPASTFDPVAAFDLLEQMKPDVRPFEDLEGADFVLFFHRFMSAWYAAREIVNQNGTDANRQTLRDAVVGMIEAFHHLQQLPADAREGQDAELGRLAQQIPRLAAVVA